MFDKIKNLFKKEIRRVRDSILMFYDHEFIGAMLVHEFQMGNDYFDHIFVITHNENVFNKFIYG